MTTFNNPALKYINISFYSVSRSLKNVFIALFTWFWMSMTISSISGVLTVVFTVFLIKVTSSLMFVMICTAMGSLKNIKEFYLWGNVNHHFLLCSGCLPFWVIVCFIHSWRWVRIRRIVLLPHPRHNNTVSRKWLLGYDLMISLSLLMG